MQMGYPKRILIKGWIDTLDFFGWNWRTLIVPLLYLVGSIVFGLWQGKDKLLDKWIETAAFGLVPVSGFAVLLFIYNVIAAPARLQANADNRIGTLEDELKVIREKQSYVDVLSDLLSEGIHTIWNAPVANQQELDTLAQVLHDWQAQVERELIDHFTHTDFIHFHRLGVVPLVGRDNTFNDRHEKILREYALKESRLREIIRDHNAC